MEEAVSTSVHMEGVSLAFGGRMIVSNLNLHAEAGEVITVSGPSGSGKSTLLRLAAGLLVPQAGRIERRARRIGMAFQTPRLLPWRTALQNIVIPLKSAGMERAAAEKRAFFYLEALGVSSAAAAWPGELSGGMAHRVSLARALAAEPDLLFLDEPMTGLDRQSGSQALGVLEEQLRSRPVLCFYITHHREETVAFSTRTLTLTIDGGLSTESLIRTNPKGT